MIEVRDKLAVEPDFDSLGIVTGIALRKGESKVDGARSGGRDHTNPAHREAFIGDAFSG